MRKTTPLILILGLIALYALILLLWNTKQSPLSQESSYIEEALPYEENKNEAWQVISGAILDTSNGEWRTIQGNLSLRDSWRKRYLRSNPLDTDNGYHPQNIFKVISTEDFNEPDQELVFAINKTNESLSPNRNESSGIFIYSRFKDLNEHYYAGIQMNGAVVIKKKQDGVFHTLAETKVFEGEYDRDTNPTLIPENTDLGIRTELKEVNNTTSIKIYLRTDVGDWRLVAEAIDTNPIKNAGKSGIRSDFMDVSFVSYSVKD